MSTDLVDHQGADVQRPHFSQAIRRPLIWFSTMNHVLQTSKYLVFHGCPLTWLFTMNHVSQTSSYLVMSTDLVVL
jgi:hypothetical protein